jgi:hypothetical protein
LLYPTYLENEGEMGERERGRKFNNDYVNCVSAVCVSGKSDRLVLLILDLAIAFSTLNGAILQSV